MNYINLLKANYTEDMEIAVRNEVKNQKMPLAFVTEPQVKEYYDGLHQFLGIQVHAMLYLRNNFESKNIPILASALSQTHFSRTEFERILTEQLKENMK